MNIKNKVAIVTGAAIRVGRAIAIELASRGAHVVITYYSSRSEAEKTVQELLRRGVGAMAIKTDISKKHAVQSLVKKCIARFGRIDILVNSAAIFYKTPFHKITQEDWDRHININLKGTFLCSHEVGLQMLKQKSGKIINIADWAGLRPYANYIPYCVSKAGVLCLTQALAKTLAPHIQVNAISPGPILLPEKMPLAEKNAVIQGTPLKRMGSPKDIANTVIYLVEGSDFVTGANIMVDGGRYIA